jgi:MGT family glycosyltransferase
VSDARPLVVVSFTTGGGWDQQSRIERTLDALRSAPVRILVTTGQVDAARLDLPANASAARFVPHADVLPMAAAVVTHGGHGTVMAALAHAVPVACLPNPFSDQPAVAHRVAQLGAGISMDGEAASAIDIREAVDQLLSDRSFAVSAAKLAKSIKASPGADALVDVIEQSRREGRPRE